MYAHLTTNLQVALWPDVCQEMFYREFEDRILRHNEDPAISLWALKELLRKADPKLDKAATEALLSHQFMKGIPSTIRLEHNPTPKLEQMVTFSKQFLAVRDESANTPHGLTCVTAEITPPAWESVDKLTRMVEELKVQQQAIITTLREQSSTAVRPTVTKLSNGNVSCYFCNEIGNIAQNCPLQSKQAGKTDSFNQQRQTFHSSVQGMQCNLCNGWGHYVSQFANNWTLDINSSQFIV